MNAVTNTSSSLRIVLLETKDDGVIRLSDALLFWLVPENEYGSARTY